MRFLKNKIARATNLPLSIPPPEAPTQKPSDSPLISPKRTSHLQKAQELKPKPELPSMTPKKQLSGDNIMKNYGRGMANFALSRVARPFLEKITTELGITLESFDDYIEKRKKSANCIKKLREMLPHGTGEPEEDLAYKIAFQKICIVFLKFFCVNWLYHSKIAEKVTHLKYRFKIMRRVRNPQYFTYLKDFNGISI